MFAQACNALCSVDAPDPQIIHKRTHEVMQQGFRYHTKQTIRQMLVRELHRLLRIWIFTFLQIARGVDLSAAEVLAASRRIEPANNVIVMRSVIEQVT